MEDKNFMIEMFIAGNPRFKDFLQSRPLNEELGESLDHYEKYLMESGELTPKLKDDIRGCHLHYLSNLLDSDIAIKTVSQINVNEDSYIKQFCKDEELINTTKLDEAYLMQLERTYSQVRSPYVCFNLARIFNRYHKEELSLEYFRKTLNSTFLLKDIWNNKESVYACSEFLFELASEASKITECESAKSFNKIVEYTYLLLSRVILWPDNSDSRFEEHQVPIMYRHKISCLNKRAEILLKHKDCFADIVPSYSTPETLAVADYYAAHDFAFSGQQVGLKSLFKRDAYIEYDNINKLSDNNLRPYNTAIYDGRRDSVELAHRLYIKFTNGEYLIDNAEFNQLIALIEELIKAKNTPEQKEEKEQIKQYLEYNNIKYFYHFTERDNIPNIKRHGGLLSLKQCLLQAIEVKTVGDMTVLRDKDASYKLEDYVRLSFCERLPLMEYRQKEGADLVLLKVKVDVAWLKETLFSDRDAAYEHHQGGTLKDLQMVNLKATQSDLNENDDEFEYRKAEVMVKAFVPAELIVNLDNPIELSDATQVLITQDALQKAIRIIAKMSYTFRESSVLKATGDRRNEKKMRTMYSFAGILGYLYEHSYNFGKYCDLVDNSMQEHYCHVQSAMSEADNLEKSVKDLANNWSEILQTIFDIQCNNTKEKQELKKLQSEIDFVTSIMESLSGSKCRKPKKEVGVNPHTSPTPHLVKDMFSQMVESATFNPYNITTEISRQNYPPLPDLQEVFKSELFDLCSREEAGIEDKSLIFTYYVLNLVKSYYDNAGYVPKNTVDAIIEQCHKAIKGTIYGWYIPTLDEMKYRIYYTLLNQY